MMMPLDWVNPADVRSTEPDPITKWPNSPAIHTNPLLTGKGIDYGKNENAGKRQTEEHNEQTNATNPQPTTNNQDANQEQGDKKLTNVYGRGQDGRFQPAPAMDSSQLKGLYLIPEAWPALTNNASLQSELGWVQAERLRIVEERGNVTVVHLERASIPAPSMAALSWLETSIRSYAKFVDIVSRALSTQVDEQESTRRERLRLDEIKALLDEMQGAC
jgi:hypothetical protein